MPQDRRGAPEGIRRQASKSGADESASYKQSRAKRCADRGFPRSRVNVGGEVMRSKPARPEYSIELDAADPGSGAPSPCRLLRPSAPEPARVTRGCDADVR